MSFLSELLASRESMHCGHETRHSVVTVSTRDKSPLPLLQKPPCIGVYIYRMRTCNNRDMHAFLLKYCLSHVYDLNSLGT